MATAESISKSIHDALPQLHRYVFSARPGLRLGADESIHVVFASVPHGSGELAALNAKKNVMIGINGAPGTRWPEHGAAPERVVAYQFRGHGMPKFRKKTGTVAQVTKAIVDFLAQNAIT